MTDEVRKPTRYERFRTLLPIVVFGGILVAILIEHSRPSRSELPVFEPAEEVAFEPVEIPTGELVLTGTVVSPDGDVGGTLVELTQNGEPHWAYADEDGAFAIEGLFAGDVDVALVREGFHPITHHVTLPAAPGEWTLGAAYGPIDGLPEIERAALYGSVEAPLRRALEDFELVFEPTADNAPLSGAFERRIQILPTGLFTLTDLAVGRYRVYALPPWARGGSWPRLAERVYDHRASAPDLRLVLDAGQITGRLLQQNGVTPLVGGLVTIYPEDAEGRVWPPVRSDEDGRFVVTDLPPGKYVARLETADVEIERRVSVPAQRSVQLDFGLIRVSSPRDAVESGDPGADGNPND